jgi:4-alpha-glucanotransferase
MSDAMEQLARRLGIVGSYTDQLHKRRVTSRATTMALLRAMGIDPDDAEAHLAEAIAGDADHRLRPYYVCNDGTAPELPTEAPWQLRLEDGHEQEGQGALPTLPLGFHHVTVGGETATLISCPTQLPLPPRRWGVMVPLHAMRTPEEGGIATYEDLAAAGRGLARHGAAYLGLNPIHAGFWGDPGTYSPYKPTHRRRLNTFFLTEHATRGASGPLVDYATELPKRRAALEAEFAGFSGTDAFEAFKAEAGPALRRFALHQALSDLHGPYWDAWPTALQDPDSPATAEAAGGLEPAIEFHAWLQWRAETELGAANAAMRAAGMPVGLYLDLAVGTHPYGAETWEDRGSFAFGASLGAPPDAFAADGQSWGLAPLNPAALIEKGFTPLAETLRRQLQFAGALRIDHILGFDRAFWVPDDGAPGAYVHMPRDAMLAVLRVEAARADAVIVGEDLGNVPRGLRPALADAGILCYELQLFERTHEDNTKFKAPSTYEPRALASFSTHDLPTWRGWRKGLEVKTHHDLGHISDEQANEALAERQKEVAGFDAMTATLRPEGTASESVDAMHHALAAVQSALVLLQIENLLEIEPQPNLPGTTTEFPNWRQRLPVAAAELGDHPSVAAAAEVMAAHGR